MDNGESLEGSVAREVKEEVGVDVKDIQYVGQPELALPSQIMVGFVAAYAGGDIAIDREELEDARWFDANALPTGALSPQHRRLHHRERLRASVIRRVRGR